MVFIKKNSIYFFFMSHRTREHYCLFHAPTLCILILNRLDTFKSFGIKSFN